MMSRVLFTSRDRAAAVENRNENCIMICGYFLLLRQMQGTVYMRVALNQIYCCQNCHAFFM